MISGFTLLAAAALVGALHMSAPDHWLTLCMIARASKWSRPRLIGFGLATATGHVLVSVVLGFAIVGAGLLFSGAVSAALVLVTGAAMVIGGVAYSTRALISKQGHEGDPHPDGSSPTRGLTYFAVLGAALSPDLTILPIFVLSIPQGLAFAADAAAVFAASSVLTLVALVWVGSMGLEGVFARIPEKYNDAMVGVVVALVGVYVLIFG